MVHPWLTFEAREKRERRAKKHLDVIKKRSFEIPRLLRRDTLESLNQFQRFNAFLTPAWRNLITTEEPMYAEPTLEFLASLKAEDLPIEDVTNEDAIRYRLGGEWRSCSLATFGVRLGLYTQEESNSDDFANSLQSLPDEELEAFWEENAEGTFTGRSSKATKFHDPLYRLIHRMLFHIVSGRSGSQGNVTSRDLFMIYCFTTRTPCNLAACVLESLDRNSFGSGRICGGMFVTRLARHHGLFTEGVEDTLTFISTPYELNIDQLKSMRIITTVHDASRLIGRDKRPWDPLRIPTPPGQGVGGQGQPDEQEEPEQHQDQDMPMPDIGGEQPQSPPVQPNPSWSWTNLMGTPMPSGSEHPFMQRMADIERSQQSIRDEQQRQAVLQQSNMSATQGAFEWLFGAMQSLGVSTAPPDIGYQSAYYDPYRQQYHDPPPYYGGPSAYAPRVETDDDEEEE